jgi:hypothetical protein
MPERKPNQIARVLAVFTLVAAFLLVIVTIASTDGGDGGGDGGGDDTSSDTAGPTAKGERALDAGVWIVGEGDNLTSIAEQTGIDADRLEELNPEIDPQRLIPGQRVSLRPGAIESTGSDPANSSADGTPSSGTGIGDGGPSATTTDSDGIGTN